MAATPAADTVSHTAVDVPAAALEEPEACTTAPLSGLVCQPASSTAPAPLLHEDKAQVHLAGLQQEGAPAPQEGGRRTLGSAGKPDTQPQPHSAMQRAWARALHAFRGYGKNVRQHPVLMLLPPLLLFALCVSLGVYGVMAGAHKEQTDRRTVVTGSATDWAASFKLSLEKSFAPLTTLAILVKQDPNYPHFAQNFPSVAHDLRQMVGTNAISELQVSPMGIISAIYPPDALDIQNRLYADIFAQPALRGGALATIQERQLVLNGPLYFINGGIFGAIARVPIFIQNSTANETFGTNKTLPTNCTDLCWNPVTGEKFWGFVTAILPLGDLRAGNDSRLDILKQKGYNWMMTRPYTSTEANPTNAPAYVFANSSALPTDPVSVHVEVSNAVWTLYLEPQEGWVPAWRNGMLLLVVLGSCVLALLVAIIFGSWAEQRSLLAEVLASNAALASTTKHLEEEKLRLDALLVRQYNLISVLGNGGGGGGRKKDRAAVVAGDSPHSESLLVGSVVGSKEGLTLDRIESMRRQLAVSTLSSAADIDSIQTLELLGEGTFGKVYKGLWRGTVVAVKTMVLPANIQSFMCSACCRSCCLLTGCTAATRPPATRSTQTRAMLRSTSRASLTCMPAWWWARTACAPPFVAPWCPTTPASGTSGRSAGTRCCTTLGAVWWASMALGRSIHGPTAPLAAGLARGQTGATSSFRSSLMRGAATPSCTSASSLRPQRSRASPSQMTTTVTLPALRAPLAVVARPGPTMWCGAGWANQAARRACCS